MCFEQRKRDLELRYDLCNAIGHQRPREKICKVSLEGEVSLVIKDYCIYCYRFENYTNIWPPFKPSLDLLNGIDNIKDDMFGPD